MSQKQSDLDPEIAAAVTENFESLLWKDDSGQSEDELLQNLKTAIGHSHRCPVNCTNGCINCRHTGYDQSPCKFCDKDGIAWRNLGLIADFIAKRDQLIEARARLAELRFLAEDFGIEDNIKPIEKRINELEAEIKRLEGER